MRCARRVGRRDMAQRWNCSTWLIKNAIQPLIAALSDPEARVREEAAKALGLYDPDTQVDPLIAALKDPDSEVVNSAAQSLIDLAHVPSWRRSQAASTDQRVHKIIVGMAEALKFRNAAQNV